MEPPPAKKKAPGSGTRRKESAGTPKAAGEPKKKAAKRKRDDEKGNPTTERPSAGAAAAAPNTQIQAPATSASAPITPAAAAAAAVDEDEEEADSEEEEEEDVEVEDMNFSGKIDPKFRILLFDSMTPEQRTRYEIARRTKFDDADMSKLVEKITGTRPTKTMKQWLVKVSSIAKQFTGELIEEALDVQERWSDSGPLQPKHIREASRQIKAKGGALKGRYTQDSLLKL